MAIIFSPNRPQATSDELTNSIAGFFQAKEDKKERDKENQRARALMGFQAGEELRKQGYDIKPENYEALSSAYQKGDMSTLSKTFAEIQQRGYRPEIQEGLQYEKDLKKLNKQKMEAEIAEYGKTFDESKKGREFRAQKEILKEIESPNKQWEKKKYLIDKKDKIVTQYKDLDRVFGNVDSLASGYEQSKRSGKPMTAADQFQLIRSFVPLSEVNPGVVREAEFDTARALSGKIQGYAAQLDNVSKGKLLPDSAIADMIDSARKLKGVIEKGKMSAYSDLSDEAESEGFKGRDKEIVLGNIGKTVLKQKQGHSEALDWAKNNPNDKRAIAILKAHGAY